MSIRWTKTVEIEQDVKLVVDTNPDVEPDDLDELLGALRDATLDDLRKACEAVGLVAGGEGIDGWTVIRNERDAAEARVTELETERDALRAQVAALQPTAERATSAQLHAIADHVVEAHEHDAESLPHAIADAVAAHVRTERCLVTRAVEAKDIVDVRLLKNGDQCILFVTRGKCEMQKCKCTPADVPATLARMLGGDK